MPENRVRQRDLSKYAGRFFSGTLLSRIGGMVRDVSMAFFFGDHPSVASFMVAFRFSHFLRRLIGEGALGSVFIPKYEELRLEDEKKASGFFARIRRLVAVGLVLLILVVEILLAVGSRFFSVDDEVIRLFAWMFPSLLFIGLYGLNAAILECKNSFFSSSVAPLVCNLTWIAGIFFFAEKPTAVAVRYLAVCTLVGFILQWAVTLPNTGFFRSKRTATSFSPLSLSSEIRSFGKSVSFALLGVGAVQINSFLDTVFAGFAETAGPVYLWYAARLYQLPLALIGLACIRSVTPTLSRSIKEGNKRETNTLFSFGLERIFLFIIPCTFAMFALAFPAVNLLFGRGRFSEQAVQKTVECLLGYAPGLLPSMLSLYRTSVFYAKGDAKTPMWGALLSILFNVILNAVSVFVFEAGAVAVAVATTIGAWGQYLFLETVFAKNNPGDLSGQNFVLVGKIGFVSLIAYLSCLFSEPFLFPFGSRETIPRAIHFITLFFFFVITFALSVRLLYKDLYGEMKSFIFPKQTNTGDAG